MTSIDAMKLFKDKVDQLGQAQVSRDLKVSPAAVSQLYHDNYKASPDNILALVIEVYGGLSVDCPVRGEVSLSWCAQQRRKPYETVTNPEAARLYKACKRCPHNGGAK